MFDFNFKPHDADDTNDDHVPTYEEFLEETAKAVQQTPYYQLFRQGFKLFQYFMSKESAFMEILAEKGLWTEEDDDNLVAKTKDHIDQFEGRMAKGLIQAAASGSLRLPGMPEGESISPDDAVAMYSEFLGGDGNLSADSIRILLSFTGQDESALKAAYEQTVASAKLSNQLRKSMRDLMRRLAPESEMESPPAEQPVDVPDQAVDPDKPNQSRTRRLEAYLDRILAEGRQMPTLDELDRMASGKLEIPDGDY